MRKPHTSTADLLVWSETPPSDSPAQASSTRSSVRGQVKLIFFFDFVAFLQLRLLIFYDFGWRGATVAVGWDQ